MLRHGGIGHPVCFAAVDAAPSTDILSEDETQHFSRLRFAAKRDAFLLGRLAAKSALGALLKEADLRRIGIESGIYGQPLVRHPLAGRAEVTVSHSHGLAVALAYPALFPMGVDLETVSAVAAPAILGQLQMSAAELAWLAAAGVDEATACCVLWTAREALGKALKIGLNCPLGLLALSDIQVAGDATWRGRYLNFPQCCCLVQAKGDRVLCLAMPGEVELDLSLAHLALRV